MLIKVEVPVNLKIHKLTDLKKINDFMEDNNIKVNKSEIARQLGINRRTVDKYLKGFEKSKHRNKPSKLDVYKEEIERLLDSETQIFYYKSSLYRYMTENYDMKVPEQTFYYYIKSVPKFNEYFKKKKISDLSSNPVIRYETKPGEQIQIDWKEKIPFKLKDTGETIHLNILVVLLGNSRFRIYKPSLWMTQDVLIHLLVESFETLGGVSQILLSDNMKTIMKEARTKTYKGKVNKKFAEFVKDFGIKLVPCIAGTPKTKGKVEAQMKYLDEILAYSGKLTLVELYDLVDRINSRVNNTICQGTGKIPIMEFRDEQKFLNPLPNENIRNQYRIKTVKVKVNTAAMISIKSNLYSVPSSYVGEYVEYQIIDSIVYVFYKTKLISYHVLTDKKLNYNENHYMEVLSYKFIGKNSEDIRQIAKNNLSIIGGIYK